MSKAVLENLPARCRHSSQWANHQPWHLSSSRRSHQRARYVRQLETGRRAFYSGRAPQEWLDALAPLGTDENKPFLDEAPVLIAIFAENHGLDSEGAKEERNYYVTESVGIATGFLIAALHQSGHCCLNPYTKSDGLLVRYSGRPKDERGLSALGRGLSKRSRGSSSSYQQETPGRHSSPFY